MLPVSSPPTARPATGPIRVALFLVLAGLALCAPARAALPDYFSQVWQAEHGLPQNAVTCIVQTGDGYLWLGTYSGLVRFDGVRFTVFEDGNPPELLSSRVTSLFEDREGALWIGHETGHLTRYRHGRFEPLAMPGSWRSGLISHIAADETGAIWLVDGEGFLVRWPDGHVLRPQAGNAPGVVAVANDAAGRLWVVRHGRASVLTGGELQATDFDGEPAEGYVQGIGRSPRGGLWVAREGRLRRWQDNRWVEDRGETPWGTAPAVQLLETRDGRVMGGTVESGLHLVLTNGQVIAFNHTNQLPQDWIRAAAEDREGNLWLGVGTAGLVALRESKVTRISPPDHWQNRSPLTITRARDDAIWIGTEGAGLYRFGDGQWEQFGEEQGLAHRFIWSAAEDHEGRLWVGTWGGGLFWRQGDSFERVAGLESVTVPTTAILHGAKGVTWIGTGDGLLRYEAGAVTSYGRRDGLGLPDVRAVLEARDGTVWFGMFGGGLGRLRDGAVSQFQKHSGLTSDYVQALYEEADGTLWIGTAGGGLNRFRNGHFTAITTSHGLPNNVICHIEEDRRGYFWISTFGGIVRVSKAELHRCADGAIPKVKALVYGKGEGLPTLECVGGLQPAGCQTPGGELWFPTSRGVVVVNPEAVKSNQLPPPVVIEQVLIDGTARDIATAPLPLRIAPGRRRIEFRYTGLSFTVPENVHFHYRVEGLDGGWIEAGEKRIASYSYIPPGEYSFHVIGCNNDGVWNETGATLAFVVLPHFWQTWWFQLLTWLGAAGVVAGTMVAVMRRRMRLKLERIERQRAIERERARIAKDIHDDLGASLTRISMLSQSARSELADDHLAAEDVDRIYGTARELTRAMDEIVWAVNPRHDTLDSLATYLGRFAQDFLSAAHLRCRLQLPVKLPAWPMTAEARHNLFLAFKESLNNVVRHARATEVQVTLEIQPEGFELSVQDNGCGFTPGAKGGANESAPRPLTGGNGLGNMRQRLREIGGHCNITSTPSQGTKVTFRLRVKTTTA